LTPLTKILRTPLGGKCPRLEFSSGRASSSSWWRRLRTERRGWAAVEARPTGRVEEPTLVSLHTRAPRRPEHASNRSYCTTTSGASTLGPAASLPSSQTFSEWSKQQKLLQGPLFWGEIMTRKGNGTQAPKSCPPPNLAVGLLSTHS